MEENKKLMELAIEARERAYVPSSGFRVGAALLTAEGKIYQGCNIENAAYTPTICAERTALFKAVSEGVRGFKKIAIVGGKDSPAFAAPCGVCRQVMREFCDPEEFEILLGSGPEDFKSYRLKELLPLGFGPEDLGRKQESQRKGRENE